MNDLPIINCDGCGGACCMEQMSPPMYVYWIARGAHLTKEVREDTDEDVARLRTMPPEILAGLISYHAKVAAGEDRGDDQACIWLHEGRCRHHEWRPQICRDFIVGGPGCRRWRKDYPPTTINLGNRNEQPDSISGPRD